MKFGQRHSIRKNLKPIEVARGLWSPEFTDWRDVIEDYLYISEQRIDNKLSMYKLQINLFMDIINNIKSIDQNKILAKQNQEDFEKGNISKDDYKNQKEHTNSQLYLYRIINKALKEIADGIVWKYFNYHRAILYLIADRQPIDTIRPDKGTINNIKEFADIFSKPNSMAILNDITNFLRVGDVTQIFSNGDIDMIEVKSKKVKGARVRRQQKDMSELVEFLNTEEGIKDDSKIKIVYSDAKDKYHLKSLKNAILSANHKGQESLLIGNYLILEIINFEKIKDSSTAIEYFELKHKSIKDNWAKNNDFVFDSYFIDKMDYSRNCAPFSIYPFNIKERVALITGSTMILCRLNYSEIIRMLQKAGWKTVDSIVFRTEEELKSLRGKEVSSVPLLKIQKGPCTLDIPANWIARLKYELLTIPSVIKKLDEIFERGPQNEHDGFITQNTNEHKNWL